MRTIRAKSSIPWPIIATVLFGAVLWLAYTAAAPIGVSLPGQARTVRQAAPRSVPRQSPSRSAWPAAADEAPTITSASFDGSWTGVFQVRVRVKNTTSVPLKDVTVAVDIRKPSRSVPYYSAKDDLVTIPDGIEPGETRELSVRISVEPGSVAKVLDDPDEYRAFISIKPSRYGQTFAPSSEYAAAIPRKRQAGTSAQNVLDQLPK